MSPFSFSSNRLALSDNRELIDALRHGSAAPEQERSGTRGGSTDQHRQDTDEWLGKDVTITEDVTEHNQRAFYRHWARLVADQS